MAYDKVIYAQNHASTLHVTDVSRVCQHSPHVVSKKSVTVAPYHTCLGLPATSDGDAKFSLPENVDLSKEDNNKLKFLNRYFII